MLVTYSGSDSARWRRVADTVGGALAFNRLANRWRWQAFMEDGVVISNAELIEGISELMRYLIAKGKAAEAKS